MSAGRPLAILHVDPERGLGGGEQQVLGLLAGLHAEGHRQTLAADPRGGLAARAAALGIAVAPLAIRNHLDVCAARRLARLLAREHRDIVHFHTARAHAMSFFLRAPAGTARVVTRRMDYRLRGGWYARRLYNREVDAVVAIAEAVRSALVASGVDPARIHLVPSGVDASRFAAGPEARTAARARFAIADGAWVLAAVGALEERKGHDVLFDALARDPDPRRVVLVAGDGTRASALRARITALGLTAGVRLLGGVDDVAPVLAAADVLVMPSRHEGLGVAALEGMAAGLPVIASRVGGLPEAIVDGETGLLVAPGDAAALAAALARLAADPGLARRLGAAGAARVASRFSMAAMAEGTLAVYRRLAAAGTKGKA
ncbi:MAG: glycosyltransferase [Deltaproteobacteria bacterium]|nr:glycosyltransferase [Deltaproteobacteria bacterium]